MQNQAIRPVDILIIEDNPGDARLMKEVLSNNLIFCQIHLVDDGVKAMNFLYKREEFIKAPRPDLIFLDLNLPRKDGREVLSEVKKDDHLKQIPIVVMTISENEDDIFKSYMMHANCYVTKPLDLDQFIKTVKSIEEFWFSLVKLPEKK
jgi:two-component system, chemotaxis family, response regulator Rcp1